MHYKTSFAKYIPLPGASFSLKTFVSKHDRNNLLKIDKYVSSTYICFQKIKLHSCKTVPKKDKKLKYSI